MDKNADGNLTRPLPALNQIYFYLTKGCNLCCRHCWLNPAHQVKEKTYPELKPEHFKSAIQQAIPLGLARVRLTGGEPLLNSRIGEILDYLAETDLQVGIETNGVLCTPEIAEKISECKKIFVSISLDSTERDVHESIRGVKGCFDSTVNGIKLLVKAGVTVQIIMTLMQCNKDHAQKMIQFAESLNVESVKFNVMQPTGRGKSMHEREMSLSVEESIKLAAWIENELAPESKIRVAFDHPAGFLPVDWILDKKYKFGLCNILGAIGVLAEGKWALCGIGDVIPDLVMGDIDKDPLDEIWKNNHILQDLRRGLPSKLEGICSDCILNELCFGCCVAQNYFRKNSIWAPHWFCEEAETKGLFPDYLRKSLSLKDGILETRKKIIDRINELKEINPALFYLERKGKKEKMPDWEIFLRSMMR